MKNVIETVMNLYVFVGVVVFVGMGITKHEFFMNAFVWYIHSMMYISGILLVVLTGIVLFGTPKFTNKIVWEK